MKDAHLAVLALALVAILFNTIGLVLLLVGLVVSTSARTLYFYHSAGECLVTSGRLSF
jgi:hypothetical protein